MAKKKSPELQEEGVIYARYSSHSQREVSIEQQVKECQKYAEAENIRITAIYSDKAVSGKTDRRPNFQKMMRDAAKGKFRYVIAWKSNRVGRNMLDAMMNDAKLRDMGIRCLYTEEDFDDTAAGRFALRNMMNVNQFYSENMAEDIRRGLMDNAEKCMVNGSIPFGYRRGKDGCYEIDPEQASIVREIYKRFLHEETFASIGADLNSRGIRTKRGNLWNKNSFHRMLTNETYIGVYLYSGVRKEGGVPPIISKEVFLAVQERLKVKPNPLGRHRMNSDYLLTGKLFCGHCGSPMVGTSGTSKTGDKHYYYSCQKHRQEKTCDKKHVQRDYIEGRVVDKIKESLMDDHTIEWLVDGYQEFVMQVRAESLLATYEQELEDVKKSLKNIIAAIEKGIITDTTKERLEELEQDRRTLEGNIAAEKAMLVDTPKEQVQFWLESWRNGDTSDPKVAERMIDTFVKAIYLYDTDKGYRAKIVCNYTGKNSTIEFTLSDLENLTEGTPPEGSYKLPLCPPNVLIRTLRKLCCDGWQFVRFFHFNVARYRPELSSGRYLYGRG